MRMRHCRPAYTLLEVLLATTIGVLLLGALYAAVDVLFRHAQAGRDVIEQSTLARALLTRIAHDISPSLGPLEPSKFRTSSSQPGGAGGASGTSAQGTTGGASGDPNQAGSSAPSSVSLGHVVGLDGPVTFNLGVQGDTTTLALYVSRVPRELYVANPENMPLVSDLRRITYWLSAGGLVRQEMKVATAEEALGVPQDFPDEAGQVLAEEVKSLEFSYWDGSAWQESWDGTAPGSDGATPRGPPLAIAITIGLAVPGSGTLDAEPVLKYYRYVVAIHTANGATTASSSTQSTGGTTSP